MSLCFLDCETLGLSLMHHDVWEIAFAFDDEMVHSSTVTHNLISSEPEALRLNNYFERGGPLVQAEQSLNFEKALIGRLQQERPVIVGSNPSFDMYRLSKRWGWQEPWSHRSIDVGTFAMGPLGLDEPLGLSGTAERLIDDGYDIPKPDHSAAGDVETVRAVYRATQSLRDRQRAILFGSEGL